MIRKALAASLAAVAFASAASAQTISPAPASLAQTQTVISVDSAPYGAKGDCVSDDTAAFQAAITAAQGIVTTSGTTPTIVANKPCYAMNIVVTGQRGMTIRFGGVDGSSQFVNTQLVAANTAKPVIQIGDGTTYTFGIEVDNANLWGNSTGTLGLVIDGAQFVRLNNLTANEFTQADFTVEDSSTQPASLIWVTGFQFLLANASGAVGAKVIHQHGGSQYITAVYFDNGHFQDFGTNTGPDMYIDGAQTFAVDTYLDCFQVRSPAGASCLTILNAATLNGSNMTLDGGNPGNLIIDASGEGAGATWAIVSAFLSGQVTLNGEVKTNQGVSAQMETGFWLPYVSVMSWPKVQGCTGYYDNGTNLTPQYGSATFPAEQVCAANGALQLQSNMTGGWVQVITDAAGGYYTRFESLALGLGGIQLGAYGAPQMIAGTLTNPNGGAQIFGDMGSLYLNNSGGAGASVWIKESGTNTGTGWTAIPTTTASQTWAQPQTFAAVGNGAGHQAFNTTTTCTTAASAGATCTTAAITLPAAEADTNYRAVCTGLSPSNVPNLETITKSAASFTITLAAITAAAASYGSFDCVVTHN